MIPQRFAALGVLLLTALHTVGAQAVPEVRVEVGRAQVSQRGYELARAALVAVFWRQPMESFTFLTSANLTYAQDSLAAAQGVAAFAIPWKSNERLRTELGAAGASFSLRSVGRGGNGNFFGRQHYIAGNRGVWLGAGYGRTKRDGVESWSGAIDAGVWQSSGPLYVSASVARHNSSDWPLLLASGVFRNPDDARYDLVDAQVLVQARNGPHDFTISYSERRGTAGTLAEFRAVAASGTLQITERFGLLGALGQQLADPLRGLPQAFLWSASARLSFGPKPLPVMQRSLIASAEVIPFVGGGGELSIRVFASDTMHVEVAGDFSEWEPLPLVREGPYFISRTELSSGKYRVAVRVNGGEWRAPRNLARVRDDYGGEAGLVVIP